MEVAEAIGLTADGLHFVVEAFGDSVYTWHHVEDGKTMQLGPTGIHKDVKHTGAAVIRNGGVDT